MNRVCIILAAGKGKRMGDGPPKVLRLIGKKTLLEMVYENVKSSYVKIDKIAIVVSKEVLDAINTLNLFHKFNDENLIFAIQEEQLGTGHAALIGAKELNSKFGLFKNTKAVVINGDTPFLSPRTVSSLLISSGQSVGVCKVKNSFGYGRIILDENNYFNRIVEEKDASEEEKKITLINSGVYSFLLSEILTNVLTYNNAQKEAYLPDLLRPNAKIIKCSNEEVLNVNTIKDLENAREFYKTYL